MNKDEALLMAIEMLEKISYEYGRLLDGDQDYGLLPSEINADIIKTYYVKRTCQEALEQQEIGDAEIKQMLNDIEWYQMRVKELEEELEAIAQHQILEAISNDVTKQQKDKQFYQPSLVDMVKNQQPAQGMKAVSYPKDNKWIDMVEQPAQEPAYQVGEIVNPYGSNIKIKQTAQEPVAWGNPTYNYAVHHKVAPSWQGLSDDEIMNIARESYMSRDGGDIKFARAIETKLKGKNHG